MLLECCFVILFLCVFFFYFPISVGQPFWVLWRRWHSVLLLLQSTLKMQNKIKKFLGLSNFMSWKRFIVWGDCTIRTLRALCAPFLERNFCFLLLTFGEICNRTLGLETYGCYWSLEWSSSAGTEAKEGRTNEISGEGKAFPIGRSFVQKHSRWTLPVLDIVHSF